jgi:hypothetical protein
VIGYLIRAVGNAIDEAGSQVLGSASIVAQVYDRRYRIPLFKRTGSHNCHAEKVKESIHDRMLGSKKAAMSWSSIERELLELEERLLTLLIYILTSGKCIPFKRGDPISSTKAE